MKIVKFGCLNKNIILIVSVSGQAIAMYSGIKQTVEISTVSISETLFLVINSSEIHLF